MKKLLLAMAAALFSVPSFSQIKTGEFSVDESSVYYGVRIGLNVASLTGDKSNTIEGNTLGTNTGFNLGAVIGLRLSETTPIFLESGLYYTERGASSGKTEVNLNYLEIPILIKAGFNVTDDIAVLPFIGPTLSLGIAGKKKGYYNYLTDPTNPTTLTREFYSVSSYSADKTNGLPKYSRTDLGLKVGCGAEWNMLYLETGFQFGLSNVLSSEEYSQHSNAFFINFGVNF